MPAKFVTALLLLIAVLPSAQASESGPWQIMEGAFARIGLGVRLEFGGATRQVQTSLALTSSGELMQRELTLPLVALDFRSDSTRLGTLLGIRLHRGALRHQTRLLPLLPRAQNH